MIDPAASFVEAARYLPALLFGLKGDLAGGLALNILLALLALPASLLLGVILGCFRIDRKSTRLNSSHYLISYAVFCLKKKK